MMQARAYTPNDYQMISSWYGDRRKAPIDRELLPRGFVVDGVAAGFLHIADGGVAFMESFVTNPSATPMQRHNALNEIVSALTRLAENNGARGIIALTRDDGIANRARSAGFAEKDYRVFIKQLRVR